MLGRVRRMVANLVNQRVADQALDEELQSAIEILARERVQKGMAASEARRQALVELGGVEQVKEAVRSARALSFFGTVSADVRFASRALRRNPGFAAAAVATMALGIGANGAVFSIVNSILLDPLPYRDPSRLVRFWMGSPTGIAYVLSGPEFFDYRVRQSSLETLSVYQTDSATPGCRTGRRPAARFLAAAVRGRTGRSRATYLTGLALSQASQVKCRSGSCLSPPARPAPALLTVCL